MAKALLRFGRIIALLAVFLFGVFASEAGRLFQHMLSLDEEQTAFVTLGCFVLFSPPHIGFSAYSCGVTNERLRS
jgi:hypothetical protein